jgi:hypothetical protein
MTTNSSGDNRPRSGATLRVMGKELDFESISRTLGVAPTHTHRLGDPAPIAETYAHDMWALDSPLDPKEPLEAHLKWLQNMLSPHYDFLKSLRGKAKVDFYCQYSCYSDQGGLIVRPEILRMFVELDVPFDISILALPDDEAGSP